LSIFVLEPGFLHSFLFLFWVFQKIICETKVIVWLRNAPVFVKRRFCGHLLTQEENMHAKPFHTRKAWAGWSALPRCGGAFGQLYVPQR
jgi:hypothetical protein